MKLTTEDIVEEWEKDCEITPDIVNETRSIPLMHHKYYVRLIKVKRALRELTEELEVLEFKKRLYYSGQATPEEYKAKPFNHRVIKSELPIWLRADEDIRKTKKRKEILDEMKEVLEETVRQINVRNFLIKNIIEYRKFEAGG